jgi:hypothetical protein
VKAGRPLRFLGVSLGGWAGARVVLLWPAAEVAQVVARLVGTPTAAAAMLAIAPDPGVGRKAAPRAVPWVPAATPAAPSVPPTTHDVTPQKPAHGEQRMPALPPPLAPAPISTTRSRFAASAWLIARGGASAGLLGGQLGASQAGMRVTYALGAARRIALSARIASPLQGQGREAAIGVDWQPGAAPVHIIVEQRIALDGGRGGPTLMLAGGFGPVAVAPGLRAEGYGQAGAIARDTVDGFADGAMRVSHLLAALGPARIEIGVGAWGGVQRGAARLDLGPSLGVVLPVAGRSLRLTLDWRQRIAGDARPGSGPALSIGSDF